MNIIVIKLILIQSQCHIKEKKMEKITIIIPVYNSEQYIKKCMESVIHQTYENLEILIIIDGATDNSQKIVEEYAKNDTRIRIISRENRGIEGIQKATSQHIYFLDADDWIEENAIEIMYQYKKKYHADMIRCRNYYKDEKEKVEIDNTIQFVERERFKDQLYEELFGTYHFATVWNQLIEKNYFKDLKDIDESINFGEDYILNLKLYKNINSLVLVPDYLYHYRTNESSISNQQDYEGLLRKMNSTYKIHIEIVYMINTYYGIEEKEPYQKIAIFRAIRGIKNRMIEWASFGIRNGKEKEVYQEIEKLLEQEEFKEICQKITQEELLKLAKQENHRYVIKNIYQKNTKKIMKYIKRIYIPGKKLKKLMGR